MSFLQSYILITNHSISRAGKPDPDSLSLRRDIQGDHFHEARPLHALPSASGGKKSSYAWKAAGYTECTESCLGGELHFLSVFLVAMKIGEAYLLCYIAKILIDLE